MSLMWYVGPRTLVLCFAQFTSFLLTYCMLLFCYCAKWPIVMHCWCQGVCKLSPASRMSLNKRVYACAYNPCFYRQLNIDSYTSPCGLDACVLSHNSNLVEVGTCVRCLAYLHFSRCLLFEMNFMGSSIIRPVKEWSAPCLT